MTARAHMDHRRLAAYAWLGSAAVHAGAVVLLSVTRIAPPRLHEASGVRFFEVQLEQPAPRIVHAPRPEITPAPKVEPGPEVKPSPHIKLTPRAELRPAPSEPRPAPSQPKASRPLPGAVTARPVPNPRVPARVTPSQPAGKTNEPSTGPSGGGGPVNLGSPSPAGDLGGLGSGSTPVGTVPGSGTGSGSGTGPGSGPGPPGTAPPGGKAPPEAPPTGKQTAGPPGGRAPEPPPKPAHVSRVADRAMPELIQRVNPQYPAAAAAEGIEGSVGLVVTVGPDGSVEKVSVTKSSGDKRLDSAAVAAVRKWKYRPAVQGGVARRVDTSATVTFRLN